MPLLKIVHRSADGPNPVDSLRSSGEQQQHAGLGTTRELGCYCGGPGGRPGMRPMCVHCAKFALLDSRREQRRAVPGNWVIRPRHGV